MVTQHCRKQLRGESTFQSVQSKARRATGGVRKHESGEWVIPAGTRDNKLAAEIG